MLDDKRALVKKRVSSPRPLHCLFTCYRFNQVESRGDHSWKTVDYLLSNCTGTAPYWAAHDLSLNTLVKETSANILRIAEFDTWLWTVLSFDTQPAKYRIESTVK
eukprot:4972101-Ditylum_brightwellii.AAC.2